MSDVVALPTAPRGVAALVRAAPRVASYERAALLSLFVMFLWCDKFLSRLSGVVPEAALWIGVLAIAVAILFLRLHRRPIFWLLTGVAMLAALVPGWWTTDDHVFLVAYWLLALGLAALDPDPADSLARHSRLLLGLVMLFATIWKLTSPAYLSGSVFHYLLLIDPRLSRAATFAGAIPADVVLANLSEVARARDAMAGTTLSGAPAVSTLATLLTWTTVLLEGALAAAFLLPGRVPQWVRDVLFLAFLAGTYALAPVLLFGILLAAMGVSQSHPRAVLLYLIAAIWVYFMAAFFRASGG